MIRSKIGSSFDDFTKEIGISKEIIMSAHIKTGLKSKLTAIIEECKLNAFRLLIEVEPSGKLYFWCDKHEKRHIIRMVRRHKIQQNLNWTLTDDKTNYVNDHELVYLDENKGKIITTF